MPVKSHLLRSGMHSTGWGSWRNMYTILRTPLGVGVFLAGGGAGMWTYWRSVTGLAEQHGLHQDIEGERKLQTFDEETTQLYNKVLRRLNLAPVETQHLVTFVTPSQDPVSKGSLNVRYLGAAIGFPQRILYKTPSDVEKLPCDLDLSSSDNKTLKDFQESCILSEKAKAFLIARAIYGSINYEVLISVSVSLYAYVIADFLLHYADSLLQRPTLRLAGLVLIVASQVALCYCIIKAYLAYTDRQADKKAAKLTPFYAEGGLEYYKKMLERHRIVNELTGKSTNQTAGIRDRVTQIQGIADSWEKGELEVKVLYDRSKEDTLKHPSLLRTEKLDDPDPKGI